MKLTESRITKAFATAGIDLQDDGRFWKEIPSLEVSTLEAFFNNFPASQNVPWDTRCSKILPRIDKAFRTLGIQIYADAPLWGYLSYMGPSTFFADFPCFYWDWRLTTAKDELFYFMENHATKRDESYYINKSLLQSVIGSAGAIIRVRPGLFADQYMEAAASRFEDDYRKPIVILPKHSTDRGILVEPQRVFATLGEALAARDRIKENPNPFAWA